MIKAAVVTVSDKGFQGLREDVSGQCATELLTQTGITVAHYQIVPDEQEVIAKLLVELCDDKQVGLIITTGGTGFAKRDVTPEATYEVIHKLAPGLAEAIRAESLKKTPKAMLSRGIAGIRGKTLIINLPGSPKAVQESLAVVLPVLDHAIEVLVNDTFEH